MRGIFLRFSYEINMKRSASVLWDGGVFLVQLVLRAAGWCSLMHFVPQKCISCHFFPHAEDFVVW